MSIIRDITKKAYKYLNDDLIMIFVGARQSGKTNILRQLEDYLKKVKKAKNIFFLNLDDIQYLDLLNKTPKNIFNILPINLKSKNILFIDEVQYLNNPTNFLKYIHDEYGDRIKLIVSGSSAFYIDKKFKDSLAGRKKIFEVNVLSFREFLRFRDEDGLSKGNFREMSLKEREKVSSYYKEYMIWGGYPRVVLSDEEGRKEALHDLAYSYIKKDIFESGVRQEDVFYKMFLVLASQIGGLVNISELANTLSVSKTVIDNYLYIMQKSFHIFLLKPFSRNMRKEITKMPKIYFMDLGLRNFFLNNFEMFDLRNDKGQLLENAVFKQFANNGLMEKTRFWRTVGKNEIDFVVEEKNAYEVKVNTDRFKEKDYRVFKKKYPDIILSLSTVDKEKDRVKGHEIYDVWEIEK